VPSWSTVQGEISQLGSAHDVVRRKYLRELHEVTGRNVIGYYSGWLEKMPLIKQGLTGFEVNDNDKNGFMAAIHGLDRDLGLDLLLHTPGGDVAATESLVDYLRSMFDDLRVIVPQLAMSAGTMIALASRQIMMGKHSSIGPIDPQIGGVPAHGIAEEFERARVEIAADPSTVNIWAPIIAKYSPTLIGECEKAIKWADEIVQEWLVTGMFKADGDGAARARRVLGELGDHALTKSHSRHISADRAETLGINVGRLEADQRLQEAVLSAHHAYVQTFSETPAFKIIENHIGVSFISAVNVRQAG
jgi:hypothetical protein